jgi:hypothetical protein
MRGVPLELLAELPDQDPQVLRLSRGMGSQIVVRIV